MKSNVKFDWITILLFLILVVFGWLNIYSTSYTEAATGIFDLSHTFGRQALWIVLSLVLVIFILSVEAKFYQRFSSVIYLLSLLSLAGLFIFGKTISGATAWYVFGPFSIQPGEFAKAATALALAKYLSDIQTNITSFKHQLGAFAVILLPTLLILPQPDPGSAVVYAAFFFPLYREGLSGGYLLVGFSLVALFVLTLAFGTLWVSVGVVILALLILFFNRKKKKKHFSRYFIMSVLAVLFSFSVNYIFHSVFQQHHRDRFNLVLGKEVDTKGIGFNTNQSEIAIGSGGWTGKGFMQGTQTKGNFVPEQHTDYIFSTVGEEWGFLGAGGLVVLFVCLLLRLAFLAERQKSQFSRVYGYSVLGILFIHFAVNIGMVIGVLPTVGIPLPFLSYGGSSLWGFTLLLFIFIRLDASRKSYSAI
ncbi:rod shape-determining protein RodA [Haloflavibacter putidus]|uniref:Cell wall polymerase n=1 Tax=Haloflavibacter putidus TaxID=2576776 RepID=A0A507ZVT0_9FLAO|nr:rod shape-determining protein RodA [Haloflavibacter putidus]TQD38875.1 rod shape-determining protein RodA [Haloflavibacter putidus]